MKPRVDDRQAGSGSPVGEVGDASAMADAAVSFGSRKATGLSASAAESTEASKSIEDKAEDQPDPGRLFAESVEIMTQLRSPGGCAWDREQTSQTLRKYLLEETYEVLDAIDRGESADLSEELGDLLLQVLFHSQIEAEAGRFSIVDVVNGLNRKLVRRHPHVFGEEAAAAAGNAALLKDAAPGIEASKVLRNWQAIKQLERKKKAIAEGSSSRLQGVLRSQPALLEAQKLGAAAARCGFDWPDASGLLAKVREEADEVAAELDAQVTAAAGSEVAAQSGASRELQLEVGDLLFMTANLARHAKVDPEMALRDANAKFRSRFHAMEQAEQEQGGPPLEERSLEQLEQLWQEAKQQEAKQQEAKQQERLVREQAAERILHRGEQETEGANHASRAASDKPVAETA